CKMAARPRDHDRARFRPRRPWRTRAALALGAAALALLGVGAVSSPAIASTTSTPSLATRLTATANVRQAPSVELNYIIDQIPVGRVVTARCQTSSWDNHPLCVPGYGTSWVFDWIAYTDGTGHVRSGFISDLFSSATPYQVRDRRL